MLIHFYSLLLSLLFNATSVAAISLEYLGRQTFSGNTKIEGKRLGGLSQIQFVDNSLWILTDDRGQYGGPRILVFEWNKRQKDWSKKLYFSRSIPISPPKGTKILDLEAFYRLKSGSLILSSEGDLNQKPRSLPLVGIWDQAKGWKDFVTLPKEFIPEKLGQQTRGLRNNMGFEGLSISSDESTFWLWSESSLYQTQNAETEILEYSMSDLTKPEKRLSYTRESAQSSAEFYRGLSDALYLGSDLFLVLERWVELNPKKLKEVKASLFLYKPTSKEKSKIKILEGDFAGNWEGMALMNEWTADSSQILVLVSDNNFDAATDTQFLFFRFKK